MTETSDSIDNLFADSVTAVRETYDRIIEELAKVGPFDEEPRDTSVHLAHSVVFAGIHPRANDLVLTLRTEHAIEHPRVLRSEQVSANRWHVDIVVASPEEIDAELRGWLTGAMELV